MTDSKQLPTSIRECSELVIAKMRKIAEHMKEHDIDLEVAKEFDALYEAGDEDYAMRGFMRREYADHELMCAIELAQEVAEIEAHVNKTWFSHD